MPLGHSCHTHGVDLQMILVMKWPSESFSSPHQCCVVIDHTIRLPRGRTTSVGNNGTRKPHRSRRRRTAETGVEIRHAGLRRRTEESGDIRREWAAVQAIEQALHTNERIVVVAGALELARRAWRDRAQISVRFGNAHILRRTDNCAQPRHSEGDSTHSTIAMMT